MELKLVIVGGRHAGREIPVAGPKFLIGRGDGCQFQPQNKLVSRKHCAILIEESSAAIEDCGSTNGTFLNGEKIQQRQELKDGDQIKIAIFEMQVRLTASLEGKKKPKVHNVQEAAVRTVASAAEPAADLDISSWLTDEDQKGKHASPPEIRQRFTTRFRQDRQPRPYRPARAHRGKKRKNYRERSPRGMRCGPPNRWLIAAARRPRMC